MVAFRELELLGHLVDKYEQEHCPIDYPDPISAIRHRMQDLGLGQKDLAAIIGSHSKVSEVLNKKRRLSLSMIRALNKQLGIPAEVLLEEDPQRLADEEPDIDWHRFPVREIVSRGWVTHIRRNAQEHAEEIVRRLYNLAGTCTVLDNGTPVIGMIIRNDRIDAFWFTLLHEIAHLKLHIREAKGTSA